jgi:hypothetical protein
VLCGETTTGETGAVLRSADGGESWQSLPRPVRPNATVWGVATHPANPSRLVAWTLFGEVYVSEDAGESWRTVARELGAIRTAASLEECRLSPRDDVAELTRRGLLIPLDELARCRIDARDAPWLTPCGVIRV